MALGVILPLEDAPTHARFFPEVTHSNAKHQVVSPVLVTDTTPGVKNNSDVFFDARVSLSLPI
jgi:hypothetical protein